MPTIEEKEQLENKQDDLELSDDDLDAVSGGVGTYTSTLGTKPRGFDDPIIGKTGFEDPLVANTPSTGFEVPLFRGK